MLILSPAYGRDYKSKKAALADFEANKDFIIENITDIYCGKPVNAEQLKPGDRIQLRFDRLRKVAVVVVPKVQ